MSTQSISAANLVDKSLPKVTGVKRVYLWAANLNSIGMGMLRLGLVIVLLWIGGLKFASYEADSIVPLVANSPLVSFLYQYPAPEYRKYMNKEGEAIPDHQQWHESNGTYPVSYGLGAIIIIILGLLIALHPLFPQVAAVGSFLLIGMSCVTLSFLFTTPEAWVPALGDAHHGFPYLSGVRPTHNQRLHHAGRGHCHDGGLGESVPQTWGVITQRQNLG